MAKIAISTTPPKMTEPIMMRFCIATDKLPYLAVPYTLINKPDADTAYIEVEVTPYALINLIYSGVQYGISLMSKKQQEAA